MLYWKIKTGPEEVLDMKVEQFVMAYGVEQDMVHGVLRPDQLHDVSLLTVHIGI